MSFDPRLLAYVESLICILAFDSIFVVILFDCCNPWSSLISLNHGSFDVIIGMDWLSKRKFVIVCHEKVVRIPLEGDEILRVHGKRTQGVVKTLLNTKFRVDLVPEATPVAMSRYRLAPLEMQELSEQLRELQDKVVDALSINERVKPRRVRAMAMTIQYGVRGMKLAAQSEGFKQENVLAERLHGACVIDFGGSWDVHLPLAEFSYNNSYRSSIRCAPFEALYERKCRSPVLWAEVGESSLIVPELVQEMTDKVALIKEKFKAARDRQKSYADNSRKPLKFEVGNHELLKVTPWKGVVRKKCLANATLHVPLDEIKVDKTLRFVEEPEISDREVKRFLTSLLDDGRGSGSWMFLFVRSGYAAMRTLLWAGKIINSKILEKVRWNSKRGPEFTWEREDYMKSKYPQLFVGRADESAS
ncbi:putative reverse transcriptase domain-containing protein [Tanacetum coccineum]